MEYGAPVTLGILAVFIVIAFIPKIPLIGRILIQLILGVIIYKTKSEAMFALPYPDSLPISELFGGDMGTGDFNKYALGVLGPVIGIVFSLIAAVIFKLMARKDAD